MYYKSRKLATLRKRIIAELEDLGWQRHQCPDPVDGALDIHAKYKSPHIDTHTFWYEKCLKRINTGEAYYALENRALELEHVSWRCDFSNPNNKRPIDTFDAFEYVHQMMVDGITWNYGPDCDDTEVRTGHINIIDWDNPMNNSFEYVEKWRGCRNDGFGWDIVLCVNAIPVGAILLEPDGIIRNLSGEVLPNIPCLTALATAQDELDHDFQFPVYLHTLIVGNGKKLKIGFPYSDIDEMDSIGVSDEYLRPDYFLMNCVKHIP